MADRNEVALADWERWLIAEKGSEDMEHLRRIRDLGIAIRKGEKDG